jgi:hypothetical protein
MRGEEDRRRVLTRGFDPDRFELKTHPLKTEGGAP